MKLSGSGLAKTAAQALILMVAFVAWLAPSAAAQTIHVDIAPTHAIKFDPGKSNPYLTKRFPLPIWVSVGGTPALDESTS
jgi:hypothetical protein